MEKRREEDIKLILDRRKKLELLKREITRARPCSLMVWGVCSHPKINEFDPFLWGLCGCTSQKPLSKKNRETTIAAMRMKSLREKLESIREQRQRIFVTLLFQMDDLEYLKAEQDGWIIFVSIEFFENVAYLTWGWFCHLILFPSVSVMSNKMRGLFVKQEISDFSGSSRSKSKTSSNSSESREIYIFKSKKKAKDSNSRVYLSCLVDSIRRLFSLKLLLVFCFLTMASFINLEDSPMFQKQVTLLYTSLVIYSSFLQ